MIADIGNVRNIVQSKLPLHFECPLIVRGYGRVVLVIAYLLTIQSVRCGGGVKVSRVDAYRIVVSDTASGICGIRRGAIGIELYHWAEPIGRVIGIARGAKGVSDTGAIRVFAPGGGIHSKAGAYDRIVLRLPAKADTRENDVVFGCLRSRPAIGRTECIPHRSQAAIRRIDDRGIERRNVALYLRPSGVDLVAETEVDC